MLLDSTIPNEVEGITPTYRVPMIGCFSFQHRCLAAREHSDVKDRQEMHGPIHSPSRRVKCTLPRGGKTQSYTWATALKYTKRRKKQPECMLAMGTSSMIFGAFDSQASFNSWQSVLQLK